ncbi:hypothetical protein EDB86DRAFT_2833447 [Lactarius hatsudake]|nr:hypothetical protein EDB86DRAFT_2833447 [Lactarius hatsudake]
MYGGVDGVGVVTGQWGVARCIGAMWQVGGGGSWCGSDLVCGRVLHTVSGWRGGWQGLACCVEVAWQGLGMCWVGVAGSRVLCQDGMGVGGGWALRAMLRRCGGLAGSWHAVLGQQGGLVVAGQDGGGSCAQMACNLQGLACHVGAVRWVGGGGVLGQDGGGSHAQMACNLQAEDLACRVGAVRWVGSGKVSGQDGGGSCARMACNMQGFACHIGVAWQVGSDGMLGWG